MQDFLPVSPEQRRAAEERLRARYEAELTRTVELAPGQRTLWPVGPGSAQGTEAATGAFVEAVRLEGSFPDTLFVLVFRHQLRPGRFAMRWRVWPSGSHDDAEPPYNDVLWVNFDEWIAEHIRTTPEFTDA